MATDERKPDAVERAARAVCMYKTGDPQRVGEFRREAQIAVEAAGVPWQPDYAEKLLLERAVAAEQRVRELEENAIKAEQRCDTAMLCVGVLEAKLASAVEALREIANKAPTEKWRGFALRLQQEAQRAISEIEQGDAK